MSLPSLLFYLGVFFVAPSSAHAQPEPRPDPLAVPAEAAGPAPVATGPTRRCRDAVDRQAGAPPVVQARCSGGFGVPAVTSGRRFERVDAGWPVRVPTAVAVALAERRDGAL